MSNIINTTGLALATPNQSPVRALLCFAILPYADLFDSNSHSPAPTILHDVGCASLVSIP